MSDWIRIGSKEYYIAKPVMEVLDVLKKEVGIDFALGTKDEDMKMLMSDYGKVTTAISLMTSNAPDTPYDKDEAEERKNYFYKNAEYSDLVSCLGFFLKRLKGSVEGSQIQPAKEKVPERKLAKMKMTILKRD